jgi:predicted RNase H-like HicB family nuclease
MRAGVLRVGWCAATDQGRPVHSQGRNREEARANVIDALRLMLSPLPSADDDRRECEALHLTIAS